MSLNSTASKLPFLGLGSEAALRAVADALPDALFTIDLAGRVTYWNRAAERITGWSHEEALGRDCSILAGDAVNGCSCGVGPLRCGLAEQGRTSKTCTLRTKDGRLLLIVKNAVPLLAPDGRPMGALESFTEVGDADVEPRCDWRRPSRWRLTSAASSDTTPRCRSSTGPSGWSPARTPPS